MMLGEVNLNRLIASMKPKLLEGEYVFCSFKGAKYGDHASLLPIATFVEEEGLTLVISTASADKQGVVYESVFSCITLLVHSSLEAVGLTAAVSSALAQEGISANVIAGYYHDHIFIQSEKSQQALSVLVELSQQYKS